MLLANIRGQTGLRVYRCHVRNRQAYGPVYRGCQKGVNVALIRPAEHDCHPRDLSALVDLVSHGCEEVGTCGKQRIQVGHHAVLVDEAMGPVELGVPGASDCLAAVIDAARDGGKVPGQSAEVCERAILPDRGKLRGVVGTADRPNNLAPVVNALGV